MSVSVQSSKHHTWIDYAKFSCIFLVVLYHFSPQFPPSVVSALKLTRMPCFFFLSGLLFRKEKYSSVLSFVKHRSKQLLIPYFCFFALFYIYWLFIGKYHGGENDLQAHLLQPLWEYIYGRPELICQPLWFVSCLFALQCLFLVVFRKIKNRRFSLLLLFLFAALPLCIDLSNSPWMFDSVCQAMPFYGIACLYSKEIKQGIENRRVLFISLLCAGFIFGVAVFMLPMIGDKVLKQMIFYLGNFSAIALVLILMKFLSDCIGRLRWVEYYASNAIVILALHTYGILAMLQLASKISFFSFLASNSTPVCLLLSVVVFASMAVPIYLINRYFPFILGKRV